MKLQTVSKVETRPIMPYQNHFKFPKKWLGKRWWCARTSFHANHMMRKCQLWWKNIVLLIIIWAVSQRPDLIEARTHKFSIHIPYFFSAETTNKLMIYALHCKLKVTVAAWLSSNISSMRRCALSPDQTPRRESKIQSAVEFFLLTSRCFIWWWNTVLNAWCYF